MDGEALGVIIKLLGAAALAVITALASSKAGAEGEGAAAPVRLWIVLHALAGGAAGALAGVAGAMAGDLGSWALFGALIGTAQWLALNAAGRGHALWVPASVLGWLPFALVNTPLTWAATGALAAVLQSVVCRKIVRGGALWVAVSAFAWLIAGVAGTATGFALVQHSGFAIAWVAGWTVVGLIGGMITAVALRRALMSHG